MIMVDSDFHQILTDRQKLCFGSIRDPKECGFRKRLSGQTCTPNAPLSEYQYEVDYITVDELEDSDSLDVASIMAGVSIA